MVGRDKWSLQPMSASFIAKHSHKKPLRMILVVVESLRTWDFESKFPVLSSLLNGSKRSNEISRIFFQVTRMGPNSKPNRVPLMRGHAEFGLNSGDLYCGVSNAKISRLHDCALRQNFSIFLADDLISKKFDIFSTAGGFPDKVRSDLTQLYNTLGCTQSLGCAAFPYPAPIKFNKYMCNGVSLHAMIMMNFLEALSEVSSILGVLNFIDFHCPNLDLSSHDMDLVISSILSLLINEQDQADFAFLMVGDHGHGISDIRGDAGGLAVVPTNGRVARYFDSFRMDGPISMLTLNRFIRSSMSNTYDSFRHSHRTCRSEQIPKSFCHHCGKCEDATDTAKHVEARPSHPSIMSVRTMDVLCCRRIGLDMFPRNDSFRSVQRVIVLFVECARFNVSLLLEVQIDPPFVKAASAYSLFVSSCRISNNVSVFMSSASYGSFVIDFQTSTNGGVVVKTHENKKGVNKKK